MTIEFWPRRLLRPRSQARPRRAPRPPKPRRRLPKLPISAGKARQMLSAAILGGDHDDARWIDAAVKRGQVLPTPQPEDLERLKERLDEVMQPLED